MMERIGAVQACVDKIVSGQTGEIDSKTDERIGENEEKRFR